MAGIDRTGAQALFEEALRLPVVEKTRKASVALSTLPVIPMGDKTTRIPVLATLPTGGFLNADQQVKPQTAASWDKVILTAEEIAAIVPVSDTVIADASIDVVNEVVGLLAQEFARIIDAAVFFGTGAPATWPVGGINGVADVAGQETVATDVPATDMNGLLGVLENLGYDPDRVYAGRQYKSLLRGQTGVGGIPIYLPDQTGAQGFGAIYGVPLAYPLGWDPTKADALAVDTTGHVIGMRSDIQTTVLREATLTGFGNLAEKDSIAIRAVMRIGYQMANPVTLESGARTYPVARLAPKP
jgi:HK97 family phage major capsid protein